MANVECAVRPPSNNKEAMPNEATVTTICLRLRHFCVMVLYKNVFLVPTPLFKKKVVPLFPKTEQIMAS
ncbi:hypothetical protein RHMOL_Rhmol02G0225900 [Rhododendron molle]|uniref:Uncharacterized protein n=1 Tax=Rhododendron molle TaxID=49168 RepID=A0ACC0PUE9_RHOML|nr:hypothetical protein RHMOL_Rhmol02G0225900 [Rhododendron molle]